MGIILSIEFSSDAHFSYDTPWHSIFQFRSRVAIELENLALRYEIGVLQRFARKHCKLTPADRLFWVWLSRFWSDWPSALAIFKPETVVAWHRAGFRRFWAWKVRRGQPGRPVISREIRALIRQMCWENPGWLRPGEAVGIDCRKGGSIRPFAPSNVAYICELQAVEDDCLTGGENK